MDRYKYYINGGEVFPTNSSNYKYKFLKKDNGIILEKTLESAVEFDFISGAFNFKTEEETNKCDPNDFVVKRLCSGEYVVWYESIFSIAEGEFDNDRCKFLVKPRPKFYTLDDIPVNILHSPGIVYEGGIYGVTATLGLSYNYPNARYFDQVVLYVAQHANQNITSLISNFFQINPDGPFYLPGVTNVWKYMAFDALSNVRVPVPSNPASKAMITFNQLMNDLKAMFDVDWYIDDTYRLRIEHRIFFEGIIGIDLTQTQYEEYVTATDKYSYDLDDFSKEEEWKIQGHGQVAKVKYGGIANVAKSSNVKSYSTTVINTDIYNIMQFTGGEAAEGLFLFATDGGGGGGPWNHIDGGFGFDELGVLCPNYLVQKLHTYRRPDLYGILFASHPDGERTRAGGIIFKSTKPIKKQVEISFPLCCDDELDLKNTILTPMGEGYLEEGSFETKTDLIKTTLKYEIDNCNDFQPNELTGLDLWLKADDVIKSANLVSQWNDSSGYARHAVQAVAGAKPTHTGIGSGVSFNSTKRLVTPAFQLEPAKRGTVIVCGTFYNGGPLAILSTQNGGAGVYWELSINLNGTFISSAFGDYPQNQNSVDLVTFSNRGLFLINRYEDVRLNTIQNSVYCNGNPLLIPNVQPTSEPLIIGSNPLLFVNAGNFRVHEIIIFGRSLTNAEMEKIDFYLVKKGIYFIY